MRILLCLYLHINVYACNIFKIYTVCVYLYIHKYAQYTCICYLNKTFILDAINRLTALLVIFTGLYYPVNGEHSQNLSRFSVMNEHSSSNINRMFL